QATGSLPVDLPSPPTFSKTNPNDQPIMYIALTSDSVTAGQLYDYASTQVGQRISILPGVSRVNVFGTKSAVRIKADPSAMWARGISVDDLAAAIKNGTSYTGAGQLDGTAGTALLRPRGQLEGAEAYEDLIVGGRGGTPVYLRDVAEARHSVPDGRVNMRLLGYSLDNLSLMALTLAIGFLVDDAIVFLENTVRRMERGERALEAAINGAREISFTILSMTISLAAVFIPLVFMTGLVGRIFREFAVTIVVAIFASGLVSLTLTPLMSARMLSDRGEGSRKTWMERVVGGVEERGLAGSGSSLWW